MSIKDITLGILAGMPVQIWMRRRMTASRA